MQMIFLKKLKQVRKSQEKTAQELATMARCSISTIYKAESETIGIKTAEDIAKALKVKVDDLR